MKEFRDFFEGCLDLDFNKVLIEGDSDSKIKKIYYMDLRQIIHRWINDPLLLKIIHKSYLDNTEPFLDDILNSNMSRIDLVEKYSGIF